MSDNLFWLLIWTLLTPVGWLGMVCAGIGVFFALLGVGVMCQGVRGKLD